MHTKTILLLTLAVSAVLPALHGEIVYNNTSFDQSTRLSAGTYEIADEIIIGGVGRQLTQFSFQYYGVNFSGNETVRVRFYNNDGGSYVNSQNQTLSEYQKPLTAFYDSGTHAIGPTLRATLVYQDGSGNGALPNNLILPGDFTVSILFGGITAGEDAGVDLYNPPTVGLSEKDYWLNDPANGGWQPRTNGNTSFNFAMQVQTVPEPSTWLLGVMGGFCALFMMRRRSARR